MTLRIWSYFSLLVLMLITQSASSSKSTQLGTDQHSAHYMGKCAKECSHVRSPICGSDGFTYDNLCYFKIARCRTKKDTKGKLELYIAYSGECKHDPLWMEKLKACTEAGTCGKLYDPVCASDGQSYMNECLMDVESCWRVKHGEPAIWFLKKGRCKAKLF